MLRLKRPQVFAEGNLLLRVPGTIGSPNRSENRSISAGSSAYINQRSHPLCGRRCRRDRTGRTQVLGLAMGGAQVRPVLGDMCFDVERIALVGGTLEHVPDRRG